jgi:rare lipoprotein A
MAPREAVGFVEEGIASHYDESRWFFFPGKTAIGERQYSWSKGAAHKTLPLPCVVRVTNLRNGRTTVVRVNDRGPFVPGRILDVTPPVAKKLGFYERGLTPVRIEVLSVGDGRYRIR